MISMEYADDITEITSNHAHVEEIKSNLPIKLKSRNLIMNTEKTEECTVNRNSNDWKKCKMLDTILETGNDIKRRKGLAIDAINKIKHILNNKKLTLKMKSRAFEAYISSIFLYISELWTMTKNREEEIDIFQRKLLHIHLLNIRWPKTISNENLYRLTQIKQWSETIKTRRLRWFGHVMPLTDNTPAKIALKYALENYVKPRGRPQTTWLSTMKKQLEDHNLTWENACNIASDRIEWKKYK